jgi:hypothetical protein
MYSAEVKKTIRFYSSFFFLGFRLRIFTNSTELKIANLCMNDSTGLNDIQIDTPENVIHI